jgi:hypothetical protein
MADLLRVVDPTPYGPPRLGLLASIEVIEEADEDLRTGIKFVPEPCGGEGGAYDITCGATVDVSGDKSTVPPYEQFSTFGVYEPESCSTFGMAGVNTDQRAQRAMLLDESKQVEKEFWTGTIAQARDGGAANSNARWLARQTAGPQNGATFPPAVTQLNGGAATIAVRALADLEQAIAAARSGGRGMIHCTRVTASYWIREQMLYRSGNLLLTHCSDTIVVAGEGYPGSSPAGSGMPSDHNTAWAYATGLIRARRTPVEVYTPASPELTTSNRRTSIATRTYALEIDPCVYVGINVTNSTS